MAPGSGRGKRTKAVLVGTRRWGVKRIRHDLNNLLKANFFPKRLSCSITLPLGNEKVYRPTIFVQRNQLQTTCTVLRKSPGTEGDGDEGIESDPFRHPLAANYE